MPKHRPTNNRGRADRFDAVLAAQRAQKAKQTKAWLATPTPAKTTPPQQKGST